MKSIATMFVESLKLPQKKAVFTLNRIGMDTTVFYMFILLAIASIPSYIKQLGENEQLSIFLFTIFFFIFHYLVIVIFAFAMLSILAYISLLFAKLVKRKLRFSILWKMAASATTIPLILFTVISFFYSLSNAYLFITLIYVLFIVVNIIFIYPKRPAKS